MGAELKVAQSGPVAFFTGCAPYFDVFFSGIKVDTLSIARDSIRLLNFLDIVPVVLEESAAAATTFSGPATGKISRPFAG